MQTFYISLICNVLLMIALLSVMFKGKVIHWLSSRKNVRERRLETKIKKIVNDYLNELKND